MVVLIDMILMIQNLKIIDYINYFFVNNCIYLYILNKKYFFFFIFK